MTSFGEAATTIRHMLKFFFSYKRPDAHLDNCRVGPSFKGLHGSLKNIKSHFFISWEVNKSFVGLPAEYYGWLGGIMKNIKPIVLYYRFNIFQLFVNNIIFWYELTNHHLQNLIWTNKIFNKHSNSSLAVFHGVKCFVIELFLHTLRTSIG